MCMHISLRPGYLQIYETSVRFFNACHPIELKCDFSIINEFNSNRIKLHKCRSRMLRPLQEKYFDFQYISFDFAMPYFT